MRLFFAVAPWPAKPHLIPFRWISLMISIWRALRALSPSRECTTAPLEFRTSMPVFGCASMVIAPGHG